MKNVISILFLAFISVVSFAQTVGARLQIGDTYTFESVSGTGMFISYNTEGRAGLSLGKRKFKVVAALNGKPNFVSFQAVELSENAYLVMAEVCPRPYTASHYYNVTTLPANADATFKENASFEVLSGNSDRNNPALVSFRVKNGTHFFKREQGVFMNAPGAGVAPQYQSHFTWKINKIATATPSIVGTWTYSDNGNIVTLAFNANGSGTIGTEAFSYVLSSDGKTLTITTPSSTENAEVISLTTTTMTIKDQNANVIDLTRK